MGPRPNGGGQYFKKILFKWRKSLRECRKNFLNLPQLHVGATYSSPVLRYLISGRWKVNRWVSDTSDHVTPVEIHSGQRWHTLISLLTWFLAADVDIERHQSFNKSSRADRGRTCKSEIISFQTTSILTFEHQRTNTRYRNNQYCYRSLRHSRLANRLQNIFQNCSDFL